MSGANTFESMAVFVDVVDAGSFSAASRQLGRAPSSVARSVAALEEDLGVRLLHRTTRSLGLTEAGRLYYERARRILADLDDARLSVSQLEAEPRGTLRLNAPVSFGRLHIAPALAPFLMRYPKLTIDLVLTDAFVDLVEDGVDLAVRIGDLQDSSLMARRLAPNRRVMCASPDYFLKHGIPARPEELRAHSCLTYKRNAARTTWLLRGPAGDVLEVEISGQLHANNVDALHMATLCGLGISILPTWLVGQDVREGRLQVIFADHAVSPTALDTAIHAVFPFNRQLSPKVRAMIDHLVARYGPEPYWECDGCNAAEAVAA